MSTDYTMRDLEFWDERIREDDERLFSFLAPAYETLGRNDTKFLEATRYFGDNARRRIRSSASRPSTRAAAGTSTRA